MDRFVVPRWGIERLRLKGGEVREILWPAHRLLVLDQRVPAKGENRDAVDYR